MEHNFLLFLLISFWITCVFPSIFMQLMRRTSLKRHLKLTCQSGLAGLQLSLSSAIQGCNGVFHVASPLPSIIQNHEVEVLDPAIRGTLNVLKACADAKSTINASTQVLIKLLKEGYEFLENKFQQMADVRNVAEAPLLVYEKPEAEGRYICSAHAIRTSDIVNKLRREHIS
ncbi:cinnamoyl-CoA reductase 1-like [Mercurialis annua]|uniref:cinnamoyl-CoA reductase 1-like n=1 Tax=Mercurialis annua TaxID=3986 RepID=UPI00215E8841|nr:cinnamoyl-CoA reductase 1-like [Mercurialis annua]